MTDEQIVRALEQCASEEYCSGCSMLGRASVGYECMKKVMKDAADLIKRQQAEIDHLREDTKKVRAEAAWDIATEYEAYKEAVEVALVETRAEAVREFAEKLKSKFASIEYQANTIRKTVRVDELKAQMDWILHEIVPQAIGDLVIEMTEKEGGKV